MIKILGIIDLLAAFFFLFNLWLGRFFPDKLVLIFALIILIKGIIFILIADFASAIDVIAGIVIILSLNMHIPFILSALVVVFLLQKGFFSLVS